MFRDDDIGFGHVVEHKDPVSRSARIDPYNDVTVATRRMVCSSQDLTTPNRTASMIGADSRLTLGTTYFGSVTTNGYTDHTIELLPPLVG